MSSVVALSPSRSITPRGTAYDRTSLVIVGDLAFEEWNAIGAQIGEIGHASLWWLGDWLQYGAKQPYGEKYAQAIENTGYEYGTLRNAASVAGRIELSRRRDSLSWGHHAEVAKLDPAEQDVWLDRAEAEKWTCGQLRVALRRARLEAARAPVPGGMMELRSVTALDLLATISPQSVDLLLTDPPYMTDVEDIAAFTAEWVPAALATLKPSGHAYICAGAYPEELAAYLAVLCAAAPFTLADVLVWTYQNTLGPAPAFDYKLNWQAIFYLRGPEVSKLNCPIMTEQFSVQDINAPDGRLGDRYHTWQKPDELAERFVRHATKPGDLVVDPFAGTGTFLLAAARLGRRALGTESDPAMRAIAHKRGCSDAT